MVSSADGGKLIGTESYLGDGEDGISAIYESVDFGTTWAPSTAPVLDWVNLANSADGEKIAAVSLFDGLWLSTNSSLNWASNSTSFVFPAGVACSGDGTRLVVAGQYGSNNIYTSLDSGNTWMTNNAPATYWSGLAMSADGSILLASAKGPGGIYVSQIPAQPFLNEMASGSNLTLFWPLPSTGFVLQKSGDLTSTNWSAVTNAVTVSNVWNQVTISPPATGNAFYRLSGP
jgi:hypothetical protein